MGDIFDRVLNEVVASAQSAIWQRRQSPLYVLMGSEIERAFAATFEFTLRVAAAPYCLGQAPAQDCGFYLIPQYVVDNYRVDFVMGHSRTKCDERQSVAIECDGHEWHEKTKEQAARDKKRDRDLQKRFGAVLHFTGSEIYRDPSQCVADALAATGRVMGFGE